MTEFLEAVAILLEARLKDDPYTCEQKPESKGWKANIHELDGGLGNPAVLRKNILAADVFDPIDVAAGRPTKGPQGGWDLNDCDGTHFPYQSHHLVPKKQLSKHQVTLWLIKNSGTSHPKYKLASDTNYNTDNADNGYFMPFASTTDQWVSRPTKHNQICFEMMRRAKRQLHQGSHSETDYLEGEEGNVEHAGYKKMDKRLLEVIYKRTEKRIALHVETCKDCKQKPKPLKVQPLEVVVRDTYRVSGMLKGLLRLNKVFVSRRAANYFRRYAQNGRLVHPANPLV